MFHNDIQQRQCHTIWCTETNEISHLRHILFSTCCEIIRSNDSAGIIWWILWALRWWTTVSPLEWCVGFVTVVLFRHTLYPDMSTFALDQFPFTPGIRIPLKCRYSDTIAFRFPRWENCNHCKTKKNTCIRLAVQLAVGVWYLASGTGFTTLSQLFGIDKLTVSKCVWEYTQTKKVD